MKPEELRNITCAFIEMAGMQAENIVRQQHNESVAYGENAFCNLIDKYQLSHKPKVLRQICHKCGYFINGNEVWIKSGPLDKPTEYYHEDCLGITLKPYKEES